MQFCPFFLLSQLSLSSQLDRYYGLTLVWPPEVTWGCNFSVWSSVSHCGNTVAALNGHSCHSGCGLDGLQSERAEAVRANHESAKSFFFRPQSGNNKIFAV